MNRIAVDDGDIAGLFYVHVAACVASPEMAQAPLMAGEFAHVARARPERRLEFAAGRAAARGALRRFGLPDTAIPAQQDRSPLWPPGYVGSVSHCEGFCGAVATTTRHAAGLGFDAEAAERLPQEVGALVCGPADAPNSHGLARHPLWPTVVFSAKEAAYKCQYPFSHEVLGFDAAVIVPTGRQDEGRGTFDVRFGRAAPACLASLSLRGTWRILNGLVLTGVWVGPAEPG